MRKFGLIGKSLTHSFSKKYFTDKFESEGISDAVYELFPLASIDQFQELIAAHADLQGLNVTIPYKEAIIPFLDQLDPVASAVGAVNTLKFTKEGLVGYNTDVYGFQQSLKPFFKSNHDRALILGTGGASKAIAYVLKQLQVQVLFVSRNPQGYDQVSYEELNENALRAYQLIVNTTPVGTYPEVEAAPTLPYQFLTDAHLLYDLVYNPEETAFMRLGKAQNAVVLNGYNMLKLQAEKAWEIWQ